MSAPAGARRQASDLAHCWPIIAAPAGSRGRVAPQLVGQLLAHAPAGVLGRVISLRPGSPGLATLQRQITEAACRPEASCDLEARPGLLIWATLQRQLVSGGPVWEYNGRPQRRVRASAVSG